MSERIPQGQSGRRRVSLAPPEWREAARHDLARAFPADDIAAFVQSGQSIVRPKTAHNAEYVTSVFEQTIESFYPELLACSIADQLRPDVLRSFRLGLEARMGKRSVFDYFDRLLLFASRLGPGVDLLPLRDERARIAVPPKRKIVPAFETAELFEAGCAVMAEAVERLDHRPRARFAAGHRHATGELFRDGAMVAFNALAALRIGNLAQMRFGKHLVKTATKYRIHFDVGETKTKKTIDGAMAAVLAPHMDRYLELFRPMIQGAGEHDYLWPSRRGGGLEASGIHHIFVRILRRELGVDGSTHDCRRAGTNTLSADVAAPSDAAQNMLGHEGERTVIIYRTRTRTRTRDRARGKAGKITGC